VYHNKQLNKATSKVYHNKHLNKATSKVYHNKHLNKATSMVYHNKHLNKATTKVYHNKHLNKATSKVYHNKHLNKATTKVYHNKHLNKATSKVYHNFSLSKRSDFRNCFHLSPLLLIYVIFNVLKPQHSFLFDVLLTVHLSIILVTDQLMHQFLFYNEFIIHLYMFQAQLCSSSGGQNCIITPIHHTYRCDDTRGCIIQF